MLISGLRLRESWYHAKDRHKRTGMRIWTGPLRPTLSSPGRISLDFDAIPHERDEIDRMGLPLNKLSTSVGDPSDSPMAKQHAYDIWLKLCDQGFLAKPTVYWDIKDVIDSHSVHVYLCIHWRPQAKDEHWFVRPSWIHTSMLRVRV